VAKLLNAKVVIVSGGGIGKPIDEVSLNQALFEKEGVEIIGVILNKVVEDKVSYVADFARRGLRRKGLELLGVVPHRRILSNPTMELICEELKAERLNKPAGMNNLVEDVVVGAMGVHNTMSFFKRGVLIITPGDREDIILAAATTQVGKGKDALA
jgi:BioD-like phosphotransacetylase family protein